MSLHVLEGRGGGGIAAMLREVARAIDQGKIEMPVEAVIAFLNANGRPVCYGLGERPDPFRAIALLDLGRQVLSLEYLSEIRPPKPAS